MTVSAGIGPPASIFKLGARPNREESLYASARAGVISDHALAQMTV